MAEVPDAFIDLLDLATFVYCADQSLPRGSPLDADFGAAWRRVLHLAVPVRRPEVWGRPDIRDALTRALSFLSEDEYHFHFERFHDPPRFDAHLNYGADPFGGAVDEVLLFSGGLDSLGGAVQRASDPPHAEVRLPARREQRAAALRGLLAVHRPPLRGPGGRPRSARPGGRLPGGPADGAARPRRRLSSNAGAAQEPFIVRLLGRLARRRDGRRSRRRAGQRGRRRLYLLRAMRLTTPSQTTPATRKRRLCHNPIGMFSSNWRNTCFTMILSFGGAAVD